MVPAIAEHGGFALRRLETGVTVGVWRPLYSFVPFENFASPQRGAESRSLSLSEDTD